jgi:hypothetical protein
MVVKPVYPAVVFITQVCSSAPAASNQVLGRASLFYSPLHGGVNARPALKGKVPQPAPSCSHEHFAAVDPS